MAQTQCLFLSTFISGQDVGHTRSIYTNLSSTQDIHTDLRKGNDADVLFPKPEESSVSQQPQKQTWIN